MMFPARDNTASSEILIEIPFLHARNMSAAEIYLELCAAVYGRNVTGGETVLSFRFPSYVRISWFLGF
jgi:hypothetical protein